MINIKTFLGLFTTGLEMNSLDLLKNVLKALIIKSKRIQFNPQE